MQIRLKTHWDVCLFVLVITTTALVITEAVIWIVYPTEDLLREWLISGSIAVLISVPISYFVGGKLREISLLTERLQYAVSHDHLTGLSTRADLFNKLEEQQEFPCVVVVADIDHFKRINDTYGHKAGDEILKGFSEELIRNCRPGDVAARFGGEEFVVLIRRCDLLQGVQIAERLRYQIAYRSYNIGGNEVSVTASFGVALLDASEKIDKAIQHADTALYEAKYKGRNLVCVHGATPETEAVTTHDISAAE